MLGKLLSGIQIYNFVPTDLLKINHFGEKKIRTLWARLEGRGWRGGGLTSVSQSGVW